MLCYFVFIKWSVKLSHLRDLFTCAIKCTTTEVRQFRNVKHGIPRALQFNLRFIRGQKINTKVGPKVVWFRQVSLNTNMYFITIHNVVWYIYKVNCHIYICFFFTVNQRQKFGSLTEYKHVNFIYNSYLVFALVTIIARPMFMQSYIFNLHCCGQFVF